MHVFCINLVHRTDRLAESRIEFEKINLEFERVDAIYHNEKGLGCALSHIECLKLAKQNNYDSCMICEDDFIFKTDKETIQKMIDNFLYDARADVLLLIGNHYYGNVPLTHQNYNDLFYQTDNSQTCTCYVIKNHYYDKLLELFEQSANMLSTSNSPTKYHEYCIDQLWKKLQKSDVWLIPKIYCGCQRPSYSDIEKMDVNYESLFFEFYKILNK